MSDAKVEKEIATKIIIIDITYYYWANLVETGQLGQRISWIGLH